LRIENFYSKLKYNIMKNLFILTFLSFTTIVGYSQSKERITKGDEAITWLGIDFSQLVFIGTAAQWEDAGEISTSELKNKYFNAWNQLVTDEPEKYDIAAAAQRGSVAYALKVTDKVNNNVDKDFFSNDPDDFYHLKESDISQLVRNYNFQGEKGIGMMIFAESMSKLRESASYWITFVDMNSKKLIFTHQVTAKTGMAIGFKNYWAKTIYNALKETKKNLKRW